MKDFDGVEETRGFVSGFPDLSKAALAEKLGEAVDLGNVPLVGVDEGGGSDLEVEGGGERLQGLSTQTGGTSVSGGTSGTAH